MGEIGLDSGGSGEEKVGVNKLPAFINS